MRRPTRYIYISNRYNNIKFFLTNYLHIVLCPIGIRKSNIDGETFCQSFPRIFFFWISSSELLKERSFRYLEIFDTNFSVLIWRKSCSLLLISFCALVAFLYPLIFVYCIIRVQAPLNTNIFRGIDGEDAVRQFRAPPPRSAGVITPLDCFPFFFFFFGKRKRKEGRKNLIRLCSFHSISVKTLSIPFEIRKKKVIMKTREQVFVIRFRDY